MATMVHPICLIENNKDGVMTANNEALQILTSITQPVVIVAIVGKYRTGKSYLMNKLAGKSGFALGSTIQSKTKGIWMWCVPHPTKPGNTLVLLDTEGLGDVEKGDTKNDTWIFALAVLLSSALVYNSMGVIDQQAMDNLHYVTELSEHIKIKSSSQAEDESDESGEFKRFFPSFIWCIRDFILKLEMDGRSITEDEYLKNSLELKKGTGKKVQDYNLPRECIRHYFQALKCFVFDRPAPKDGLRHLDDLQDSELEPEFVKQANNFCSYVYENCKVKSLTNGITVTGRILGNLTVTYLEAILSGTIPCMENAVTALAQIENSQAVEEALIKYDDEMCKYIAQFPTETQEEFLNFHQMCESQAIPVFMNRSFKDEKQEYQGKLIIELAERKANYSKQNEDESIRCCKAILEQLSESLERSISDRRFFCPGGHKEFQKEMQALVNRYNTTPKKGIKALEVLQEFLKEKQKVAAAVLQADQRLTEKEKEVEEQKARTAQAERDRLILVEKNEHLQKNIEDQNISLQKQREELENKMEEDRKKMIEENKWMIEERLKEQQEMFTKGLHSKVEMLSDQIQSLKRQNEEANEQSFIGKVVSTVFKPVDYVLRKIGL